MVLLLLLLPFVRERLEEEPVSEVEEWDEPSQRVSDEPSVQPFEGPERRVLLLVLALLLALCPLLLPHRHPSPLSPDLYEHRLQCSFRESEVREELPLFRPSMETPSVRQLLEDRPSDDEAVRAEPLCHQQ